MGKNTLVRKRNTNRATGCAEVYACHNCKYGASEHCFKCTRVDNDDKCIASRPHMKSENWYAQIYLWSSSEHWDDGAETALRFLLTITNFTPIEMLVALAFARGGGLDDIRATVLACVDRVRSYCKSQYDITRQYRSREKVPRFFISRATVYTSIAKMNSNLALALSIARLKGTTKPGCVIYNPMRLEYLARSFLDESNVAILIYLLWVRGVGYTDIGLALGDLVECGGEFEMFLADIETNGLKSQVIEKVLYAVGQFTPMVREILPGWPSRFLWC